MCASTGVHTDDDPFFPADECRNAWECGLEMAVIQSSANDGIISATPLPRPGHLVASTFRLNERASSAYLLVGAHVGHGLLLGLPLALVAMVLEPDLDLNELLVNFHWNRMAMDGTLALLVAIHRSEI